MGCAAGKVRERVSSVAAIRVSTTEKPPVNGSTTDTTAAATTQPQAPDAFSERNKKLIMKTWRYLSSDLTGHGINVFLKIFSINPAIKNLFPCKDKTHMELLQDRTLKGHGARFMQTVGAAIDNLDTLQTDLKPILIRLGRSHIDFGGFKPSYFDSFTKGMMLEWQDVLGERFNEETKDVWFRLFEYIMGNLKEGYFLALRDATQAELTSFDKTPPSTAPPGPSPRQVAAANRMMVNVGIVQEG